MKKYKMMETIPTETGEKRYCLEETVDIMFDVPVKQNLVMGTKEEVEKYIKNNNIDLKETL